MERPDVGLRGDDFDRLISHCRRRAVVAIAIRTIGRTVVRPYIASSKH
jgi:hypothetical protein